MSSRQRAARALRAASPDNAERNARNRGGTPRSPGCLPGDVGDRDRALDIARPSRRVVAGEPRGPGRKATNLQAGTQQTCGEQRAPSHTVPSQCPSVVTTPPGPAWGPAPSCPKHTPRTITPRLAPCLAGPGRLPGCPGAGPGPESRPNVTLYSAPPVAEMARGVVAMRWAPPLQRQRGQSEYRFPGAVLPASALLTPPWPDPCRPPRLGANVTLSQPCCPLKHAGMQKGAR